MPTTVSSLLTRLRGLDDEQAWEVFNDRYFPMLQRFFRKRGFAGDTARDLAQDTIQRAITGLRRGGYVREQGRLRDWVAGIARNVERNYWRKRRPQSNVEPIDGDFWESREDPAAQDDIARSEQSFDSVWVRAQLSALLREAANCFSKQDLRCYFLVELRRLPIAEVARRLGLSESAVFAKRRLVADWFLAVGPRFFGSWEQ
jgi:RNA polymerase sigma factor (sigma-70 family)